MVQNTQFAIYLDSGKQLPYGWTIHTGPARLEPAGLHIWPIRPKGTMMRTPVRNVPHMMIRTPVRKCASKDYRCYLSLPMDITHCSITVTSMQMHIHNSVMKRKCPWLQETYGSSNKSSEVASISKKRSRESDAVSANLPRRQNKTPDVAVSRKEVGIMSFPHSQQ